MGKKDKRGYLRYRGVKTKNGTLKEKNEQPASDDDF